MQSVLLLLATTSASFCGCASSKWAMDDPDYAKKYGKPYSEDEIEKVGRMAKQLVDARHAEGKGGLYVQGAGQSSPPAAGGEIGAFGYGPSWLSGRIGLALLGGTDANDLFTGLNMGVRVQSPSRVSPFGGLGVFAGYSEEEVYDENCGCRDETVDNTFFAIYPEIGVHFWLTGKTRLTASGSHFINSEGRDHDFWFFGLSVAWLSGEESNE